MQKLCLIFNMGPRYREAIFTAIDRIYDCDWFFGPKVADIEEMNYKLLKTVKRYKVLGNPTKLFYKLGIIRLLFKKEYQTFFVLLESRCLSDWLFIFIAHAFFPKKKIYTWGHTWYGKESKIGEKFKLWSIKRRTGIFTYGQYAKDCLIEKGINGDRLFVIHNSLHYDQQKKLRNTIVPSDLYKKYFCNENPTLVFIGRLTKVKKLDMIIDALFYLKDKGENYNMVFVGDGVERQRLEKKTKDMGLQDSVWFYGACYDERQNAELLYNADLCVSPGNVGLTAIHTMVFGCPVITHNCFKWQMPEHEAIKPGITGDFFEMDNTKSLSDTISNWFVVKANKRDDVRKACFAEIDSQWNPYYQIEVIKNNLVI